MSFLQSVVVPVCLYSEANEQALILSLQGTAFFIGQRGVFLTARHVVEAARSEATRRSCQIGLVTKADHGKSDRSMVTPLTSIEFAPAPYDVAVGKVSYRPQTFLHLGNRNIAEWQDVATLGYPENAVEGEPGSILLQMRCLKGYIQRTLQAGISGITAGPQSFEISFLLSRGLSGAPLFIHQQPRDLVIGVCVGSHKREIVAHQYSEVDIDGKRYTEKVMSIEQYGIAHDLRPLHNWKPKLLEGSTLVHEGSSAT